MRASWATLTLAVTVHSVPLSQPHARRTRGAPDDSEAEVAGMSGSCGQRTRDSHGNMRAKLSDYIGQVFECKADSPHYSRRFVTNWQVGVHRMQGARLA